MTEQLKITGLAINYRPTSELTPHAQNSRTHTKKQIQAVARSIQTVLSV